MYIPSSLLPTILLLLTTVVNASPTPGAVSISVSDESLSKRDSGTDSVNLVDDKHKLRTRHWRYEDDEDEDEYEDEDEDEYDSYPPVGASGSPQRNGNNKSFAVSLTIWKNKHYKGTTIYKGTVKDGKCHDLGNHAKTASSLKVQGGCCYFFHQKGCGYNGFLFSACSGGHLGDLAPFGHDDVIVSFNCGPSW